MRFLGLRVWHACILWRGSLSLCSRSMDGRCKTVVSKIFDSTEESVIRKLPNNHFHAFYDSLYNIICTFLHLSENFLESDNTSFSTRFEDLTHIHNVFQQVSSKHFQFCSYNFQCRVEAHYCHSTGSELIEDDRSDYVRELKWRSICMHWSLIPSTTNWGFSCLIQGFEAQCMIIF